MKNYLAVWCFLDQGMEGIPDLSNACIVNGKDEKAALKNFPKEIKKLMKGYGCATIIGEIVNDHICPRTAYPSCNAWTKDNCLEYRRVVYDLYDKVKERTDIMEPKTPNAQDMADIIRNMGKYMSEKMKEKA